MNATRCITRSLLALSLLSCGVTAHAAPPRTSPPRHDGPATAPNVFPKRDGGNAAAPADAKAPTMGELVDRLVTALGGAERWKAITSRRMTIDASFAGLGATTVEMVELARVPNHKMVTTNVPGLGPIMEGFDGEVAWSIDPMRGPMIGSAEQARQQTRISDFHRPLHLAELYPKVESITAVDWHETPCWAAKVSSDDGDRVTFYFARDTGLLRGEEMTIRTSEGEIATVTVNKRYGEFDGVKLVAEAETELLGQNQSIVVRAVQFNVPEAAQFELPPAIKALRGRSDPLPTGPSTPPPSTPAAPPPPPPPPPAFPPSTPPSGSPPQVGARPIAARDGEISGNAVEHA